MQGVEDKIVKVESIIKKAVTESRTRAGVEEPLTLDPDKNLQGDYGLDSLDVIDIINEIEDEFDIMINENDIANLNTCNQIRTYIYKIIDSG